MNYSSLSVSNGIGGEIKQTPKDFIVEEISKEGEVFELDKRIEHNELNKGDYSYFILQKTNYTTTNAIKTLSKYLNLGKKRINYAGMKDKIGITTQLCSAYKTEPTKLLSVKLKDIKINGVWKSKEEVRLGHLLGNRFKIKVRNIKYNQDVEQQISKIYDEMGGKFINYFGEQRFGSSRKHTHKIGEFILRGRVKEAVLTYLCDYKGEKNQEAISARKQLSEDLDFKNALNYFPKYLKYERTLLAQLSICPTDYIGALRKLPRKILLLFIHAFQSYLFNLLVSERIKEQGKTIDIEEEEYFSASNEYGFPNLKKNGKDWLMIKMIGYESKLSEREERMLERFMIHQDDFKLKSIPEISSKGTYRSIFSPLINFKFKDYTFYFDLVAGSYATVAINEFIDEKNVQKS